MRNGGEKITDPEPNSEPDPEPEPRNETINLNSRFRSWFRFLPCCRVVRQNLI